MKGVLYYMQGVVSRSSASLKYWRQLTHRPPAPIHSPSLVALSFLPTAQRMSEEGGILDAEDRGQRRNDGGGREVLIRFFCTAIGGEVDLLTRGATSSRWCPHRHAALLLSSDACKPRSVSQLCHRSVLSSFSGLQQCCSDPLSHVRCTNSKQPCHIFRLCSVVWNVGCGCCCCVFVLLKTHLICISSTRSTAEMKIEDGRRCDRDGS
jgi:hypothetical protein